MSDFTEAQLRVLRALADGILHAQTPANGPAASAHVAPAPDSDLDSQWGDGEIRKDPPRWTGGSQVGRRYSECPPEYLESLASFYIWRAGKETEENNVDDKGRPRADWSRRDAARCLGWAARLRAGWQPRNAPASAAQDYSATADDSPLPF